MSAFDINVLLTLEFLKVPNMYLIELSFIYIASSA
jgi:hypothetical protein